MALAAQVGLERAAGVAVLGRRPGARAEDQAAAVAVAVGAVAGDAGRRGVGADREPGPDLAHHLHAVGQGCCSA